MLSSKVKKKTSDVLFYNINNVSTTVHNLSSLCDSHRVTGPSLSCAKLKGCNDAIWGLAFTHLAMISFIFKIITLNYIDLKHSVWLALTFSCKSSHEVNMTSVICTFTCQVMTGQSTFVHNNLQGQPVSQPRAGPGQSPTRPLAPKLNRFFTALV